MSTTLTVADLGPEHQGCRARVTLPLGDVHEGQLTLGRNPSYRRLDVRHWYLTVQEGGRPSALSLQWMEDAPVVLL